jgi:hypothetical protein
MGVIYSMMKLNIQLFAKTGYVDNFSRVTNGKNAYMIGRIKWTQTPGTSVENFSLVDLELQARRDDSFSDPTQARYWKGQVKIVDANNNLTPISFTDPGKNTTVGQSWVTIYKVTGIKVKHNDDGTCKPTISGYVTGPTGTSFAGVTTSGSQTEEFDTIPRASSLDSFSGNKRIGVANDVTINFTKKNATFTTTIEYATKSDFSDAVKIVDKTANASTYTWTIPISLLSKIPNSKTLTIYIRLTTFNGTTQIGNSVTSNFVAQVYDDNCRPTFNTHTIEETDATAKLLITEANKFATNLSKPKFTFSASGQYGATIKSYQINNIERASGFIDSNFNNNGYILKITDSRGVTNSYTFNVKVVPYFTPIFEKVYLFRDTPTSNKVFSYFKIIFFNNTSNIKFDNPQSSLYKFDYQEGGASAQSKTIIPTTSDNGISRTAENETELGTTFNYKRSIDWTFIFKDVTGRQFATSDTLPMGIPLMNGKMEGDGEQILYINGNTKFPQSPSSDPIGIGFGNNIVLRQSTDGDTVLNGNKNLYLRPNGNTNNSGEAILTQDGDLNITRNLNALNVLVSNFLKIPNGEQGGLCNQSNMPIIQDYNNANVTLNATGNELFIGFLNTRKINMFQKIDFHADGNISKRNSDGSSTYFALVSELLKMTTFNHGANWFHVRFSNGFAIIGGSGTAKSSGNTTINYGVTFSEAPIVLTQARTTNGGVTEIKLYSKGTSSMQVVLGGSAISSVTCDWIAFGYIA